MGCAPVTDTNPSPEPGSVLIPLPVLKQMISWSLLCLGIIEKKDQDFEVSTTAGGVIVRTGKR